MAPAAPIEPTQVAQPAPEQPNGEAVPTNTKQAAVKKQHRRTARPANQNNPFANFFGNGWRGHDSAQPRYSQRSWYNYR